MTTSVYKLWSLSPAHYPLSIYSLLSRRRMGSDRFMLSTVVCVLVAVSSLVSTTSVQAAPRPWPNTSSGIHVFNDQLSPGLSDAQVRFAAKNYEGTQKLLRQDADRIRGHNSNFLVLHYRLGHGLGYRLMEGGCNPSGGLIHVIEGNEWVQEYPGGGGEAAWFVSHSGSSKVLNCDWGWYLMDISNSSWRNYWHGEVLRQLRVNDNDGVFMDSLSVPNYLGAGSYNPGLPAIDEAFEDDWSARIRDWIRWLQAHSVGDYYIVPNVGSWITSRDKTDYSDADGVMVEGFALEADSSPYSLEDWRLQMDRILGLVSQGKAVIGQNYATGAQERMFSLGTYLLVKGERSFINIDSGEDPEWWPEYDIGIGRHSENAGTSIGNLAYSSDGIYRRRFSNGIVLVNATNPWDGTANTRTVDLGRSYQLARTSGGGTVPESGSKPGEVTYETTNRVTLEPYSAAVLLGSTPSESSGIRVKFTRPRIRGRSIRLKRRAFARYLKRGLKARVTVVGGKVRRVSATVVRKKGRRCYRLDQPRKKTSCERTYRKGVKLRHHTGFSAMTYSRYRNIKNSKKALPDGRYRIRLRVVADGGRKMTFNYTLKIRS